MAMAKGGVKANTWAPDAWSSPACGFKGKAVAAIAAKMWQGLDKCSGKGMLGTTGQCKGKGVWPWSRPVPPISLVRTNSNAKKRKAHPSTEPLEPLNEDQVNRVTEFLTFNGGSAPLGRVTTEFPGMKKKQLENHFMVMSLVDGSDPTVSLDGGVDWKTGSIRVSDAFVPKRRTVETDVQSLEAKPKKRKKGQDRDAPPPEPLDELAVQKITALLEEHGGGMSLGRLVQLIEGVKKKQLEPHFHVAPFDESGQPWVALEGFAAGNFTEQGFEAVIGQVPKKKLKKIKDPTAPPPPELDTRTVQQIKQYLSEAQGVAALGRLTTDFPGVKKIQLMSHFVLGKLAGKDDPIVCLDAFKADAVGAEILHVQQGLG